MSFQCIRAFADDGQLSTRLTSMTEAELSPGDVLIDVQYSGINYKDALAATGRGKIIRHFPCNVGIDLAGKVLESTDPNFAAGDSVLLNGSGLGETHDGGMAQRARVKAESTIKMPPGLDAKRAMLLGTAGFTAMLCIHRMEENGQQPEKGPIVVTGATGGVGSIATLLLAQLGYEVIAVTGRKAQFADYLRQLGAEQIMTPTELELGSKPLEKARFGGAIDNVGGEILAQLFAHTELWGNIACVGMAANANFQATVFPLILRGVSLLGVSSANCPMTLRRQLWQRLGAEFSWDKLEQVMYKCVKLETAMPYFAKVLDREIHGRVLIDCG